jgi:hypothetical protein
LEILLRDVSMRCLFWLDGHYSGGNTARGRTDTPISMEVRAILDHSVCDHVILIDDARLFDGTHDYPAIPAIRELVATKRPSHVVEVLNDVIRIHPTRSVHHLAAH